MPAGVGYGGDIIGSLLGLGAPTASTGTPKNYTRAQALEILKNRPGQAPVGRGQRLDQPQGTGTATLAPAPPTPWGTPSPPGVPWQRRAMLEQLRRIQGQQSGQGPGAINAPGYGYQMPQGMPPGMLGGMMSGTGAMGSWPRPTGLMSMGQFAGQGMGMR